MVLWVDGDSRYIRQNYLALHDLLEIDVSVENQTLERGKVKCFEEQEEEAITRVTKELARDIPFLVVIDNLDSEKDWWDQKIVMELLPQFGGVTHFIITTHLPKVMNLEPMKLSYLSGVEALSLMKGGVKDYPLVEIDALRIFEEKLGRLTLGLSIIGAILAELPITPSKLLDTINRMPTQDILLNDKEVPMLNQNTVLIRLLDVCLSIFDHAEGPRSLAARMVLASGWFAPSGIPLSLLSLAAKKALEQHSDSLALKKCWRVVTCYFTNSSIKRSEAEASSMLVRFRMGRSCREPNCIYFHELIKLYARKRGGIQVAQAMVQATYLRGSISENSEHLWAACYTLLRFRGDPTIVELKPSELLFFIKRVALPLAIHSFIALSRCNATLELLRLASDALEASAEALLSQAAKRVEKSFCCIKPARSDANYTYLWQELALLRATVLETRAKLMLRGGQYDTADDLIRKAIFIRTSICGEHHPDTISARKTLSKLTRLLTKV